MFGFRNITPTIIICKTLSITSIHVNQLILVFRAPMISNVSVCVCVCVFVCVPTRPAFFCYMTAESAIAWIAFITFLVVILTAAFRNKGIQFPKIHKFRKH
jgi:hypothetical protein